MGSPKAIYAQNDSAYDFSAGSKAPPFQARGEKFGLVSASDMHCRGQRGTRG